MMDVDNHDPDSMAAQSLRAAALLSRKRRRVEQAPALPQLPPVEQTMQLDYGQEESSTSTTPPFTTQNHIPPASDDLPTNSTPDIEDGQIREEGEISDTEEVPPLPAARPTSPPPKFRRLETSSKDNLTSRPVPASPVIDSNPPPRPSTRLDSPFVPSKPASEPESFQYPSPTFSFSHSFILETPTYRLDADHVRPGLAMTQDQYNTAKDIVLDLLGWGVSPEYLLDCGLGRHAVYYIFTEFNLRLPDNLDTSDLIPYPTPEMMSLVPASPSQSIRSHVSSSSVMPPPTTIPSHREFSSPIMTSGLDRPGSKPAARLGLRIPSLGEPTDIKVEPTSPSSAELPSSQSLHMIEQLRRQELLARKAVFASRKVKNPDSPGGPSTIRDRDVENTHVAATEIVEDFLKSIPAVDSEITDSPTALHAVRQSSHDTMEVDNGSPVLNARQSGSPEGLPGQPAFNPSNSGSYEARSTISPSNDAQPSDTYSGASLSAISASGDYMAASSSVTPTSASTSPVYDSNGIQRRGTKRPVAADFVDLDHGPGPSRTSLGNGYSSNGYVQPVPLLRRKTGSFAGVSGTRRCVINLSDSEDDGDGEGPTLHDGPSSYSPTIVSARPPRLGGGNSLNSFANGEGRSTPPNLHSANTNTPLGMSPAALVEKEEEIKRMRQMIAQREELRQKKLAAMSGKATPTIQSGPLTTDSVVAPANTLLVPTQARVSIKQEDNIAFIYNGHVGNAQSSHQVDAVMGAAQDNEEPTAALQSTEDSSVISNEEATFGESRNNLTSANETIGGVGFEPINTGGDNEEFQGLMMTEEACLEQWVSSNTRLYQTGDEHDVPSSSQVPKKDIQMDFASYDSPFSTYPLLLSQLPHNDDSSEDPRRTASHSARSTRLDDLKPLKLAALQRTLGQLTARNSGLRVCQYEVPGGGICRDKDCNDLHLGRLVSEPSDGELAAYVHGTLPQTWRSRCDVRAVEIALERVRLGGKVSNVDERVRSALAGLGLPVIP